MKKKDYLRLVLILAIFFLALGGWLLHLRIHPIAKDVEHYIPARGRVHQRVRHSCLIYFSIDNTFCLSSQWHDGNHRYNHYGSFFN